MYYRTVYSRDSVMNAYHARGNIGEIVKNSRISTSGGQHCMKLQLLICPDHAWWVKLCLCCHGSLGNITATTLGMEKTRMVWLSDGEKVR